MNGDAGIGESGFYLLLQLVAKPVRSLYTDMLGYYQVKVNITLAPRLAGSYLMETG